jgi:hypothetical protein
MQKMFGDILDRVSKSDCEDSKAIGVARKDEVVNRHSVVCELTTGWPRYSTPAAQAHAQIETSVKPPPKKIQKIEKYTDADLWRMLSFYEN